MFWIPAEEGNGTSRCEKCYKEDFNKVRTSNSNVAEMPFKNALQERWNNFFSCSFMCSIKRGQNTMHRFVGGRSKLREPFFKKVVYIYVGIACLTRLTERGRGVKSHLGDAHIHGALVKKMLPSLQWHLFDGDIECKDGNPPVLRRSTNKTIIVNRVLPASVNSPTLSDSFVRSLS